MIPSEIMLSIFWYRSHLNKIEKIQHLLDELNLHLSIVVLITRAQTIFNDLNHFENHEFLFFFSLRIFMRRYLSEVMWDEKFEKKFEHFERSILNLIMKSFISRL